MLVDGRVWVFLGVLLVISAVAGIGVEAARARAARVRSRSYVVSAVGLILAIACFIVGLSS